MKFSSVWGLHLTRLVPSKRVRVLTVTLTVSSILLLLISCSSIPTEFTVSSTLDLPDEEPGDGRCDDGSGNCTLRAAIMETNALADPDTVRIPTGIYALSLRGEEEDASALGDLDILGDLTIIGEGREHTVIEGDGSEYVMHIVGSHVTIASLAIQNNSRAGGLKIERSEVQLNDAIVREGSAVFGGGINLWQRAGITIMNSLVSSNHSRDLTGGGGGGIYVCGDCELSIADSRVQANTSDSSGGGIYTRGASRIEIRDSTLSGNVSGRDGGAVAGGHVLIEGGAVFDNSAAGSGGGVWSPGDVTLRGTVVSGNSAAGTGGGVWTGGEFLIEDSVVSKNVGTGIVVGRATTITASRILSNEGSGISQGGGTMEIFTSTIDGNAGIGISTRGSASLSASTVSSNGEGGILSSGSLTVVNSTVSQNRGIGIVGGELVQLQNVTVVANGGPSGGGGLHMRLPRSTGGVVNSIIADHPMGGDCHHFGMLISEGYNLDSDGSCGFTKLTDLPNTDPKLGPLSDHGGPTETHLPLPGSPTTGRVEVGCPVEDQRGITRPIGGGCDIGASEVEGDAGEVSDLAAPASLRLRHTLRLNHNIEGVVFSPSSSTLLTWGRDNLLRLWDLESGTLKKTYEAQSHQLTAGAFSKDGTLVATGGVDGSIQVWDVQTGRLIGSLEGHSKQVHFVAFLADTGTIVSQGGDGNVILWDLASATAIQSFRDTSRVAVSPSGGAVAFSELADTQIRTYDVRIWTLLDKQLSPRLKHDGSGINRLVFDRGGQYLVSASGGKLWVWETATYALEGTMEGIGTNVFWADYSPTGAKVALDGSMIMVLDPASKAVKYSLGAGSAAFSPDGKTIAGVSRDDQVRIWDADSGELMFSKPDGACGYLGFADFSPDNRNFATWGNSCSRVAIWDLP